VVVAMMERGLLPELRCSMAMAATSLRCIHVRLLHLVEELPRVGG